MQPRRRKRSAAFKTRFADNALVIDKWFTIQATAPGRMRSTASAAGRIRLFTANPNRVRALVGTFAFSNPTGFNRADGDGYAFLAEQILDIEKRNPQLAARILTSMRSWRSLEASGRARAQRAARDRRRRRLSADVSDIVERMLSGPSSNL